MWAQFLFSIFKVCFFDMSKFNSFHTNGSDQAPGAPNQVPRASDLGHLVLVWWIHWGRVSILFGGYIADQSGRCAFAGVNLGFIVLACHQFCSSATQQVAGWVIRWIGQPLCIVFLAHDGNLKSVFA